MMRKYLHAAFSFISILAKGKEFSDDTMQKSVYAFPFVGAVIFLVCSLISLLVYYLTENVQLTAVFFLISGATVNRGLHYDGLADVCDAAGSGKRGEEFRKILKDSRIGSFGVMGLIFHFLLAYVCIEAIFAYCLKEFSLTAFAAIMVAAGMWSRLGLLALPFSSSVFEPQENAYSTAKAMFGNFEKIYFIYWYIFLFFACSICLNASFVIICSMVTLLVTCPLHRLAQRENGYNGDFLGAACLLWENAFFVSFLLYMHL